MARMQSMRLHGAIQPSISRNIRPSKVGLFTAYVLKAFANPLPEAATIPLAALTAAVVLYRELAYHVPGHQPQPQSPL